MPAERTLYESKGMEFDDVSWAQSSVLLGLTVLEGPLIQLFHGLACHGHGLESHVPSTKRRSGV